MSNSPHIPALGVTRAVLIFVALSATPITIRAAPVNLGPLWDQGQYWVPRTYDTHTGGSPGWNAARKAVDFYWSASQQGNYLPSAIQGASDGYDSAAETGRGKNVLAPHAGVATVVIYKFNGDCGGISAQPELKLKSGGLTTYYIHLETPDPIGVNDSVTVFNKGSGLNLRTCASTGCDPPITTMPDGTRMNVIGGPTVADGYTWWNLQGYVGGILRTGWAVEEVAPRKTLINGLIDRNRTVKVVGGLNLRSCASTSCDPPIVTMPDGTSMTVIGGPVQADGYTWWNLQGTVNGTSRTGWAVDDTNPNPAPGSSSNPTLGREFQMGDVIGLMSDQGCALRPHLMLLVYLNGVLQAFDDGSVLLNGETIFAGSHNEVSTGTSQGINYVYSSMPRATACTLTLNSPEAGATVSFPATFTWSTSGTCPNTHLAFARSSSPSSAQVTGQLSGSGIITAPEWGAIQAALGASSTYYWTVVESDGQFFDELANWRSFQPVSSITSVTPTPVDGANATINQTLEVQVNVAHELITSGVLQVWLYDGDFSTSEMDWVTITGPQSGSTVFSLNITYSSASSRNYTILAQFRPGAAAGPLLSSGINDVFSQISDYTINWREPRTWTLSVGSDNPSTGVAISVSPNDTGGLSNGSTLFRRTYNNNTAVTLTAPSSAGGNAFQKWQRDGLDWATTLATSLTMDSDHTMVAVFTPPPGVTTLASGLSNPSDIAVDNNNVYWTDYRSGSVQKIAKAGGAVITLVSGLYSPSGLALDNDYVYFAENVGDPGSNIKKVPKNGGTVTPLASGLHSTAGIAVSGGNVYWTDFNSGSVLKVPVTGGSVVTLATESWGASGVAVDGTSVYWTEFNNPGPVRKVSVNGGSVTIIGPGSNTPGISADGTFVYWTEYNFSNGGRVNKVPAGGGTVISLATGLRLPWDVAVDASYAFWVENFPGGAVKQVLLSGGTSITLASGLAEPVAIAVDGAKVYWVERNGGAASSGFLKCVSKGTIVPDTFPPSVTISSPTSDPTYTTSSSSLNLAGTATDNTGVTQVTWSNDRGGTGNGSGTGSWTISNLSLQSGVNMITVTARDSSGNAGSDTLRVTFSLPPSVATPTVNGGAFSASIMSLNGVNYYLEFKNSLNDPRWSIAQSVTGNGTIVTLRDTSATARMRFYRIRVE